MAGSRTGRVLLATAAFGVAGAAVEAQAGGFAIREQSAYGQGWSFAGAAAGGPGVSGMFWNPALATNVEGLAVIDNSYSLIIPKADVRGVNDAPFPLPDTVLDDDNIAQAAFAPASSAALRVTDDLFLGITIGAPFGLVTKAGAASGPGEAFSSRLFSINATPTLAYRVNDWLSVGAGVQVQYFKAKLKVNIPPSLEVPFASISGIDAEDYGFGFTLGAQFRPWAGTEIGVGFRSSIAHNFDGDAFNSLAPDELDIGTRFRSPEMVSVGIRQRVTDSFTLAGTVEWTNWSRLDELVVNGPGNAYLVPTGTVLPFDWQDGWFFSLGGEYQWSPELSLRAGVAYEISPVTDDNRTTRLPDDDRVWLSAGLTWDVTRALAFDAGYSFIFSPGESSIDEVNLVGGSFTGDSRGHSHVVSLGLRYKFGLGAAEPVVAKY